MGATSPEADLARAKSIRSQAKGVKDPGAARRFEEAAVRLEARAAKKVSKLARRRRPKGAAGSAIPKITG